MPEFFRYGFAVSYNFLDVSPHVDQSLYSIAEFGNRVRRIVQRALRGKCLQQEKRLRDLPGSNRLHRKLACSFDRRVIVSIVCKLNKQLLSKCNIVFVGWYLPFAMLSQRSAAAINPSFEIIFLPASSHFRPRSACTNPARY